jgi:hypothetical protein
MVKILHLFLFFLPAFQFFQMTIQVTKPSLKLQVTVVVAVAAVATPDACSRLDFKYCCAALEQVS